jgi:predicted nucleic acid-binding protein
MGASSIAGGSAILVDSSALVYLVEGEPDSPRRAAVERFLADAEEEDRRLVASALIWTELLEKPLAAEDARLADRYRSFLSGGRIELRVVDVAVADRAAELFASLAPGLRRRLSSADLVHIATALVLGASAILGNDDAWRRVPRCPPLLLVDELAAELASERPESLKSGP